MTLTEVLAKLHDEVNPSFRNLVLGRTSRCHLIAGCPLGDVDVELEFRQGRLWFTEHRWAGHPQSTRCYWSGKPLLRDSVGAFIMSVSVKERRSHA